MVSIILATVLGLAAIMGYFLTVRAFEEEEEE